MKTASTLISLAVVAALSGGGYWWWQKREAQTQAVSYRTAKVDTGGLVASVSASGTLNAVVSVQVGSQVSGQIKEVLVDFNSEVKKDQLIARIDPETFEYRVRQAQADVDAARASTLTSQASIAAQRAEVARVSANLAEAKRDFERKKSLVEKKFISASESEKAEAIYLAQVAQLDSAKAQANVTEAQSKNTLAIVAQREAALAQARIDLERTQIKAPVDGIVVKRSIEPGQTVAASLSSPELFVIAQSLRDMQVDTSIDEAEIGRMRTGLRATFTVDSFPGRTFQGEVKQVRKAAQVVSNVVTYTVVVSAANPDLALVPGMTANVRLIIAEKQGVRKVSNAALRFRPPGAAVEGSASESQSQSASSGTVAAAPAAPAASGGGGGGPGAGLRAQRERLVKELGLDADQQGKLEDIYAGMRERFMGLREMPEAERSKAQGRIREEMREKISAILKPEQKPKYEALANAAAAARAGGATGAPTRGRVYINGEDGKPKLVQVRLGLTDGTMTELIGDDLKEGEMVLTGVASGGTAGSGAAAKGPSGPRLPF